MTDLAAQDKLIALVADAYDAATSLGRTADANLAAKIKEHLQHLFAHHIDPLMQRNGITVLPVEAGAALARRRRAERRMEIAKKRAKEAADAEITRRLLAEA